MIITFEDNDYSVSDEEYDNLRKASEILSNHEHVKFLSNTGEVCYSPYAIFIVIYTQQGVDAIQEWFADDYAYDACTAVGKYVYNPMFRCYENIDSVISKYNEYLKIINNNK